MVPNERKNKNKWKALNSLKHVLRAKNIIQTVVIELKAFKSDFLHPNNIFCQKKKYSPKIPEKRRNDVQEGRSTYPWIINDKPRMITITLNCINEKITIVCIKFRNTSTEVIS